MNIHVLQHDSCEGPGAIADWARERGFPMSTTHFYRDELPPAGVDIGLLVVMGGPMNIYQDRDYPWLRGERTFIASQIAAGKRVVGICLGSQFLADALGSRVTQNAQIEIGWLPVQFSAPAREKFSFLPESLLVTHWHGDTFSLPEGAMRLAVSEGCANQGFLFDNRVLALQFHPEVTREALSMLVAKFGAELRPGKYVQTSEDLLAAKDATFRTANGLLFQLLDALISHT